MEGYDWPSHFDRANSLPRTIGRVSPLPLPIGLTSSLPFTFTHASELPSRDPLDSLFLSPEDGVEVQTSWLTKSSEPLPLPSLLDCTACLLRAISPCLGKAVRA